MTAFDCKLARNEDVAWRGVADEGLLVDPRTGRVYPMEPVAFRLWQMSDGALPLSQIIETLLEEFDVPKETLEADIHSFVQELRAHDLLRAVET